MNRILLFLCLLFFGCSEDSEKLKLLFAGDLMLDRGIRNSILKNGPDYLFKDVKEILSNSDITHANLECAACDTLQKPLNKKFTFRANPEWLHSLSENGITHVSLANNHSFDFGEEGFKQTVSNLKKHGIDFIGYHPDPNSYCSPTVIEKNESKVLFFASSFLKQNDSSLTCNENASTLANRIKQFKKDHPSYFIFLNLHWGIEMQTKPSPEQITQAHLLMDAGADVIIGHHPHVVQTIEEYKGKYIFYSIGNFIFDNNISLANKGIFVAFSLYQSKIESVQIIPFNIVKSTPRPMATDESQQFMVEISSISPTLNFKRSGKNWQIL